MSAQHSTMIIRFFADWCTSEECKRTIEKISEAELFDWYGSDRQIYITAGDDYTHVMIFNGVIPEQKFFKFKNMNLTSVNMCII